MRRSLSAEPERAAATNRVQQVRLSVLTIDIQYVDPTGMLRALVLGLAESQIPDGQRRPRCCLCHRDFDNEVIEGADRYGATRRTRCLRRRLRSALLAADIPRRLRSVPSIRGTHGSDATCSGPQAHPRRAATFLYFLVGAYRKTTTALRKMATVLRPDRPNMLQHSCSRNLLDT
jgi:hypothetical protein